MPVALPAAVGANCTLNVVLWPAVRVKGRFSPLRVNPDPLAVAAEMVRLVPPELVRVSVRVFEPPDTTFPKLRLVGLGVICPCVTPVPESATSSVGSTAFESMTTVPVLEPAAAGAKTTLNDVVCPAGRVSGRVSPLKLNPVPLTVALEIVTLEPPVLVSVTATLGLLPIRTFPKSTLLGVAVRLPGDRPRPERAILSGELDAVETIASVPLTVPVAAGAKVAVNVTLWFGLRVAGKARPLMENPAPVTLAWEMVTVEPPVLVSVSDKLVLLPT